VYNSAADIYVYFYQRGIQQLKQSGRLSYITSNGWLRTNFAQSLRHFLRTHATIDQLVDLGDNRVFADAPDVYPAILVARQQQPPKDHTAQAAVFNRGEGVQQFHHQIRTKLAPVSIYDQHDSGWQLGNDAGRKLFDKLMACGKPLDTVVDGHMYRGVVTGFNDAFIIDQAERNRLVQEDPNSAQIIKPIVRGEDLRPWYQEDEGRYLIFTRRGIDINAYPAVKQYLEQFRERLEPRPSDWNGSKWPGRKPGPYAWYEIQDSVDYYEAFDAPKFFWPELAKRPRFSWDDTGTYVNNKGFFAPVNTKWLLGILNSRVIWFTISFLALGLGERAGAERYQLFAQYISRLPIPDTPAAEREAIGSLAMQITEVARTRYKLHERARRRILSDLGGGGGKLNQKLTRWWELDFATFRAEVKKALKHDIPLKERDEWDEWLEAQREKHQQHTAQIVQWETDLNGRVYALFDLSPAEIAIIEESTKYQYGEV
jgi:hypothetical protein